MVHVLPDVESTTYPAKLGSGKGDEGSASNAILTGCVCAGCGGSRLRLMRCWVLRWLCLPGGARRLWTRLARCLDCRARERILPCDALPSKQASVQLVVECVSAVEQRKETSMATVIGDLAAKGIQVSRQLLAKWITGLRARGDDLFRLLRHRALIAPPRCAPTRCLVSFAQALDSMKQAGLLRAEPEPKDGLSLVLHAVRAFEQVEGLARFGAAVFRQAALLFRSPGTDTPSCIDSGMEDM